MAESSRSEDTNMVSSVGDEEYQCLSPRSHVLRRPDMYISSVQCDTLNTCLIRLETSTTTSVVSPPTPSSVASAAAVDAPCGDVVVAEAATTTPVKVSKQVHLKAKWTS